MKDMFWASLPHPIAGSEFDDSKADDNNRLDSKNNNIYYYTEVSRGKNLSLNMKIEELSNDLVNRMRTLRLEDPGKIYLHINSYGGSVFAGFSSVDYIMNSTVPVVSVIEGCAASAATIMSVVASHRQINKHAYMLIHQLSSGMWGKYQEQKDAMENNDRLMKMIIEIYEEHTKIPKKELNKLLKHDLWWDAETCLKYGLVDEIV
jgi:ATP-dependent protease ClpP protease subunit|tara:strand:+ start:263 stop:877 length:615 start_codon:yes stop_codon:yes gene_type:complete